MVSQRRRAEHALIGHTGGRETREAVMHLRSTQLCALAAITTTVALPQAASARPIDDPARPVFSAAPVTPDGGGHDLTLPLAGVTLAVILTGAGTLRWRTTRPRAVARTAHGSS
jgi:hypothetical protein